MFKSCRQLSRLTSHHHVGVKAISSSDDKVAPFTSRSYSGSSDERDGRPNHSGYTCPFVAVKNIIADYLGLIGAGFIVGFKFQQETQRYRLLQRPHRSPPPQVVPNVLIKKALSIRDRYLEYQYFPVVLRASPVNHATVLLPPVVSSSETTSDQAKDKQNRRRLLASLNEHKRSLVQMSKSFTSDLANKIGVALIESGNAKDGVKCLKANATCARVLYNLAVAYETGRYGKEVSKPDLNLAFEYYDRAAQLDHKFATYNLALFYLYGKGPIERDVAKGSMLMEKALRLGVDRAAAFQTWSLNQQNTQLTQDTDQETDSATSTDLRPLFTRIFAGNSSHEIRNRENLTEITGAKAAPLTVCF